MAIKQIEGCRRCCRKVRLKDTILKMGGLLCPTCRVILFYPGLDKEYFFEHSRREALYEKNGDT